MMKTYSGLITKLEPNQIFVFGSNTQGRHGRGSALFARLKCGAIYGQAEGLQGRSYAIVTKDLLQRVHPSIPSEWIIRDIAYFYQFAKQRPMFEFLVAYNAYGTNLNGYTNKEMAQMFKQAGQIPDNIIFEENFAKLL